MKMKMVMAVRSSMIGMMDGLNLTDLLLIALRTAAKLGARSAVTIPDLGKILPVGVVEHKTRMVHNLTGFSIVNQAQQMILARQVEECLINDHQRDQVVVARLCLQSVKESLVKLRVSQERMMIRLLNPIRLKSTHWEL
jgi:hypothetical protein